MRRLLIDPRVCTEVMGALVAMAWADGELQDEEKRGLLGAADALNIPKEMRARVESFVQQAPAIADLDFRSFSERHREFAYVAAAWMAHMAEGVVDSEKTLLAEIGESLEIPPERQAQLDDVAGEIERPAEGERWSNTVVALFRSAADKVGG